MTRTYKGRSAQDRKAERRERLLEAAFELWGEHGWAAVTMRGVCAGAGLNDRYFYENFADVEALLLAVFDRGLEEQMAAMAQAIAQAPPQPHAQARAAIAAFVRPLADDRRKARIGLVEPAGSTALERRRRDTYRQIADLAAGYTATYIGPDAMDAQAFRMNVLFGIGGTAELITTWLAGGLDVDLDTLVDQATGLLMTLAAPYLPG